MKRILLRTSVMSVAVFLLLLISVPKSFSFSSVQRITKEELKAILDNPNLVVVDVRVGLSWDESDKKIKGAVREDPLDVKKWADRYSKDKTLVIYCS